MRLPSKETLTLLRSRYPKGARVELIRMDDPQAPPIGTKGTVLGVDDMGSILVAWDNGSGLNVAFGEDVCCMVGEYGAVSDTVFRPQDRVVYGSDNPGYSVPSEVI